MANKSEKATPKKLKDARKKGQVAKSQDFPSAFTFVVSILLTLSFAHMIYERIGEFMVAIFTYAPTIEVKTAIGGIMRECFSIILAVSLPIAGLTAAVGVIVNFLIIGPTWAIEGMKPDLKKLDPIQGLKNKLFKGKVWVELIKSLLKVGIAAYLIYTVVYHALAPLVQTAALPLISSAMIIAEFLKKVVWRVGVFFLAVAIFDLTYQKRVFAKEMKMEKFQVKQEHKDLEGDPQIKGRRREMAREIAYGEGGASSARKAKVVVTNPTHVAVALAYQPEKYAAPYILTMGMGGLAEQIMSIAEKANVPIMRNVDLARMLFEQGTVNRYIPEEAYDAVGEVLTYVMSLDEQIGGLDHDA